MHVLLEDRRFVVAGGASGVGAAAARAFVREGARVAILDVNAESGRQLAEDLGAAATFLDCDVTKKDVVDSAFSDAVDWLGGLDGAMDTAGTHAEMPAHELTVELWYRTFETHVLGTVLVNQAAFPYLKDKGGRIINCGSGAAHRGQIIGSISGAAHYASAKGAVESWTLGISREWGQYNITANLVIPAIVTPMYEERMANMPAAEFQALQEKLDMLVPLGGRFGDADVDFSPAVVFLASDMSRFISGHVLAVTGGAL